MSILAATFCLEALELPCSPESVGGWMIFPSPDSSGRQAALFRKAAEISSVAYSMGIPPGVGYILDRFVFQSTPICLIVGAVLGFLEGMRQLFRIAGPLMHQDRLGSSGRRSLGHQRQKPGRSSKS